jgi:hypothetical protein
MAVHHGPFNNIAPSGKDLNLSGCSFYLLEGETIKAGRIYFNMPSLMEQIGIQP